MVNMKLFQHGDNKVPDLEETESDSSGEVERRRAIHKGGRRKSSSQSGASSKSASFLKQTVPEQIEELTTWLDQWLTPEHRRLRKSIGSMMFRQCSGMARACDDEEVVEFRYDRNAARLNFEVPIHMDKSSSVNTHRSQGHEDDCLRHDGMLDGIDQQTTEEEEDQLRRLGSWETNGTFGTIGTNISSSSLSINGIDSNSHFPQIMDDDGNPIDPKLLEKTIVTSQRRSTRRKRVVKFEYPPVSSMKQCPRLDKEDLPKMFFSEGELDQLEEDRNSTYVADDVEIVAVASTMSDKEIPTPPPGEQDVPGDKATQNYVSTPRRKKIGPGGFKGDDELVPKPLMRNSSVTRGSSTLSIKGQPSTEQSQQQPYRKDKRLIKSVQIYLRERSTGTYGRNS